MSAESNIRRRGFIASLGGVFAVHTTREACAELARTATPRARALAMARLVNTAQDRDRARNGGYVPLSQLAAEGGTLRELVSGFGDGREFIDLDQGLRGGTAIPGFKHTLTVTKDRAKYTLHLVEQASGYALITDSSGVIMQGAVDPAADTLMSFNGKPIVPSARALVLMARANGQNPLRVLARRALSAIVPGVSACCSICAGQCWPAGNCSQTCPDKCCALGYGDCTWCCTSASNCNCVFWLC